jgi:hypothetical protein
MDGNMSGWLIGGAAGGAILGLLTGWWGRIKNLFWRFLRMFFITVDVMDEVTSSAVLAYLSKNYRRSSMYDRTYGSRYEYLRTGKYGTIPFEFFGGKSLVFWRGWFPISFGPPTPQSPAGNNTNNGFTNNSPSSSQNSGRTRLFFIRGTFDAEKIVAEAAKIRNDLSWDTSEKNKSSRFFIRQVPIPKDKKDDSIQYSAGTSVSWFQEATYRLLSHETDELGRRVPGKKKALDMLMFPQRIKDLIQEIIIWRRNRDWYVERGIPWKRGWLLYGPPGTGKTALVRAFAEDLDMPLFVFSLGELLNSELQRSWEEMQAHSPCIALFEDIDNVFHGRTNIIASGGAAIAAALSVKTQAPANGAPGVPASETQQTSKLGMLSFDCLLNCLDGVSKADGTFVVISTNHIDKIDEALGKPRKAEDGSFEFISTRPGRIDKAIELTYMEADDMKLLAERILFDCPEGLEKMMRFVESHPDLQETPAQFQERCAQMALSYFWRSQIGQSLTGLDSAEEMGRQALRISVRSPEETKQDAA